MFSPVTLDLLQTTLTKTLLPQRVLFPFLSTVIEGREKDELFKQTSTSLVELRYFTVPTPSCNYTILTVYRDPRTTDLITGVGG